jgi:hypothetical protein
MDSIADEVNLSAKESIVFRRFHSFYILTGPGIFKQHVWCSSTCDVSVAVVFGNENDLGNKILDLSVSTLKLIPFS